MVLLGDLPTELILHITSFLTRERFLDEDNYLPDYKSQGPELVPDLHSINSLSKTNTAFHNILDHALYQLCASVKALGQLALLFAVQHRLESAVERLVAAGVSLDTEFIFEHNFCGLLHIAAGMGLEAMVVKLLEMHGAEMIVTVYARRGFNRWTALDYAARMEHLEIVRLLAPIPNTDPIIRDGIPPLPVSIVIQPDKLYLSSALIQSVKKGNLEISQYLVSQGADVNFFDIRLYGGTPLYFAAGTENLQLVSFLLASGADPNLNLNDNTDYIPLFHAACNRHLDIVQALLVGGADMYAKNRNSCNVLAYCVNAELLRFFLERGVDPNLADRFGDTPLHRACSEEDPEFALASVELLLQFGATTVEKTDGRGLTPVDIAITEGYTEILELLEPLVQNADLKQKIATWWEET
ncbi:ankyrin repeat-containing domain protein [Mycena galopus ATCC 62051]|nr:ankyrin repeat-containing domain protein [Mycena galopus ATCC 62051]